MQEVIAWLMKVEQLAGDCYSKAGCYFGHDKPLQRFLESSAEDEAWHYRVMASALENVRLWPELRIALTLDPDTCERIEAVFHSMTAQLSRGTLTEAFLFDGIAKAEFSEWNDMFLYVVNTLKQRTKEFHGVAPRIENHKRNILHFLEGQAGGALYVDSLKRISSVWQERILIVEDDEALREVLGAILAKDGAVDTAPNGRIGIAMARSAYYRIILSDIDMPEVDGFQMFDALRESFPTISSRFVFMSGYITPERRHFLEQQAIDFLLKPSSIREIRACVQRNLRKETGQPS
jgi:CheY-like chemotaxis protein